MWATLPSRGHSETRWGHLLVTPQGPGMLHHLQCTTGDHMWTGLAALWELIATLQPRSFTYNPAVSVHSVTYTEHRRSATRQFLCVRRDNHTCSMQVSQNLSLFEKRAHFQRNKPMYLYRQGNTPTGVFLSSCLKYSQLRNPAPCLLHYFVQVGCTPVFT